MGTTLLKNIIGSFFSKVGEKLVDYGLESVTGKKDDSKFMLETLRRSLNSLSDKASDMNDQIRHGEQSGKKKRKREIENWLKEVQKIQTELGVLQNEVQEKGFLSRFFAKNRVSELNTRVHALVDQSHHLGELLLDTKEMKGEAFLTGRLIGKAFEKNIEVIWKWLVIDKVKSIGIYGMGGVGKTTLAKHINNRLLKESHNSVYWVTVSRDFTINKLQSDIAKVIGLNLLDEDNEDKRAGRLNQALSKKEEFVLILDDVWSDIDLEKMGDPLGVGGCRMIVTTRSLSVCRRIDCREIIDVKTLQADESWNLFRETLGERMTLMTSEVEEIAKCVAKECDGLPLGIIVLAKSMKGVTDIREWRNVYDDLCESPMEQNDMKEKVFRVLEYSFNKLDPEFQEKRRRNGYNKLQLCFSYCSLYPEDYIIDEDELIRKFISEELLDRKKILEKQLDQGCTMLSKLVDLRLLERIRPVGENFKYVKMHDLFRDMALSIARKSPKYKVFGGLGLKEIPNEEEWTKDADKISLMINEIEEIPIGMAPNCPKLATLLLNRNPLLSIPESFFAKMSGLRILDLSETKIQKLPNCLSDLESLNALLLKDCFNLVSIPYLGKLKGLTELDLSMTSIEKMPKGMENLINLKILLLRGAWKLKLLSGDLPLKSRNLQHLELPIEIEVPVYDIEWSKLQLKEFVGRFKDVSDFNWFQSKTGGLISNFYCYVGSLEDDCIESNLLEKKTPSMRKCRLRRGEMGDGVINLPEKIKDLEIVKCKGLSSSTLLDEFKPCSIEHLVIDNCEGIESIWNINNQLMAKRAINISHVELIAMPELKSLVHWEVGDGRLPCPPPQAATLFSSLQQLFIFKCNKMKNLGLPLQCLHNIRRIMIGYCAAIEELIELVEETKDDEEISEPTISFPNLVYLGPFNLPKLKSICNAKLIDCKSIKVIRILGCPRVKKLPSSSSSSSSSDGQVINYSPLPALTSIIIDKNLWESLEWDDPIHKHLLQPFVRIFKG